MKPIICKNETRDVLEKLQEYADNDGIIKSLYLVDQTQEQTVILVAEEPITKENGVDKSKPEDENDKEYR